MKSKLMMCLSVFVGFAAFAQTYPDKYYDESGHYPNPNLDKRNEKPQGYQTNPNVYKDSDLIEEYNQTEIRISGLNNNQLVARNGGKVLTDADHDCIYNQIAEVALAKDAYRPFLKSGSYEINISLGEPVSGLVFGNGVLNISVDTKKSCFVVQADRILAAKYLDGYAPAFPTDAFETTPTIYDLAKYILDID